MTSMQSIDITGFNSGVQNKNKKPFLMVDDAFTILENAYVYRQEVRKREGLQLIGRYRRVLEDQAYANADGTNQYDIADILSAVRATETNAEIEPGSIVITLDNGGANETEFTDQGNGLFLRTNGTAYQIAAGTYINYVTGLLHIDWDAGGIPPGGTSVQISYSYYPMLPSMGIWQREIDGINDEQTIWFDTKYAYIHDGSDFQEFLPAELVTWNGTDSDFFWATNYRGSDPQDRLFFVTNFVPDAGSPMRYTDGADWETFQPIIAGTTQTEVLSTTLAAGSVTFGPAFLANFPIVQGTVVITVSINGGGQPDVVFRDTPKDGTLVSSGSNSGTIDYDTGEINLTFSPALPGAANWTVTAVYSQGTSYLFSARILIPYYGRLIALNTWEGETVGGSVNIFNRCRFSQIGSPVQQDAWRSDVFGKGGFVDAPVNEEIISARFYKNTLICFFERSTWRLQYVGEYGLPFIWERISSDFGSESTFSTVLFDNGVLAIGDKAIVGSSGNDVQRIDSDIPNTVYDFKNSENGVKRVQGVRDFKKELVYWCYPDYPTAEITTQYFPNKTLVYNYKNNTFAFFRNSITTLGTFQLPVDVTWDRLDVFWDSATPWDSQGQSKEPMIVSGNQVGFAHFYNDIGVESGSDSTMTTMDQESLAVKAVTVTSVVTLTIPNHNLLHDEIIYLTGLIYTNTDDSIVGSTTLNDFIYSVEVVDKDNVILSLWDEETQKTYQNFTVTNVGTYLGGGVVALFPKLQIRTKDFNPVKQVGQNIKTSFIDFLFDASSPSPINVLMRMNTSEAIGNILVGNQNVETSNSKQGYVTNVTRATPGVVTSKNHGLLNGDTVSFSQVRGMTELNAGEFTVTFISTDTFSIGDTSTNTPYTGGGYWSQTNQQYFTLSAEYAWHRFFATCFGQFLSVELTYTDSQMFQLSTHQQNFVLNAMKIWFRPGGSNIFGK